MMTLILTYSLKQSRSRRWFGAFFFLAALGKVIEPIPVTWPTPPSESGREGFDEVSGNSLVPLMVVFMLLDTCMCWGREAAVWR